MSLENSAKPADNKPFLPQASAEHKAVVVALALCALEWESLSPNGAGAWVCRMCKAITPGVELWAFDAQHYGNCPVKAAQDGRLQYAMAQVTLLGGGSPATVMLRIIGEVLKAASFRNDAAEETVNDEPQIDRETYDRLVQRITNSVRRSNPGVAVVALTYDELIADVR